MIYKKACHNNYTDFIFAVRLNINSIKDELFLCKIYKPTERDKVFYWAHRWEKFLTKEIFREKSLIPCDSMIVKGNYLSILFENAIQSKDKK